jgi:hypothetical protein
VHKGRRWRLNIKVKEMPFAEGSSKHVLELLFVKQRDKKLVLRGGCLCQRLAMGFLLSSIQGKFLREILALCCSFIKLGTPPHFSFHKLWLTDSIGCPPTFTYHGGVPFLFFLFLE